ncbi:MAG TPA: DUF3551 domain-containing protein [Xanthobacteraceae bacterium]|nr:DUF3551 domain-containing protein [Xanthobacteraceae bacterium]
MRLLLLSGAVIATLATMTGYSAAVPNDLYCVEIHGNPGRLRCGYETLGACQLATNSGEGICIPNPRFRREW